MAREEEEFPRDYRKLFKIIVALATMLGPPILYVRALEKKIDEHTNEYKLLKPDMIRKAEDMNHKLDLLIEDCYRRGGCNRTP